MTTTQLEFTLLRSNTQQVNVPRSILVKWHRLEQNIVASVSGAFGEIDNFINGSSDFEGIWVHLLADLAFETLPVEWTNVLVLSIWRLFLFLSENPVLKALKVDKTYSTNALASRDKRIVDVLLWAPANSALNVVFGTIFAKICDTFYLLGLLEFLFVQLTSSHLNLLTLKIFDSEAYPSEFDSIKLLNFVIIFSSFIFEGASNQPEPVYRFFFLVLGCLSMIKVVALCVLLEKTETSLVGICGRINNEIWFVEVNLVVIPDDLPLALSF